MKKYIIMIIPVILILILAVLILPAPDPARCRLCESVPYHAPCLVDLATGEVGELTVYYPHPFTAGELSDDQPDGTFCLMSVCGQMGYIDRNNWIMHISVPQIQNEYEEKYFCNTCRELLMPYSQTGFVLADLKEPSTPKLYSLSEGAFELRCYVVNIRTCEDNETEIDVTGTLDLK